METVSEPMMDEMRASLERDLWQASPEQLAATALALGWDLEAVLRALSLAP